MILHTTTTHITALHVELYLTSTTWVTSCMESISGRMSILEQVDTLTCHLLHKEKTCIPPPLFFSSPHHHKIQKSETMKMSAETSSNYLKCFFITNYDVSNHLHSNLPLKNVKNTFFLFSTKNHKKSQIITKSKQHIPQ